MLSGVKTIIVVINTLAWVLLDGSWPFSFPGSSAHSHTPVSVGDRQPVGGPERGVSRGDTRAGGRAHIAQHGEGRAGRRGLQRYTAESPVGTGRGTESGLQTQEVRVSRDGMSPCKADPLVY